MRSKDKTVLFSRVAINKAVHQWPVAVFNSTTEAKTFAAYLKMAHSNGDVETAKRLDSRTKVGEDGKLAPDVKWTMLTLPYQPSPITALSDDDIKDETPTE